MVIVIGILLLALAIIISSSFSNKKIIKKLNQYGINDVNVIKKTFFDLFQLERNSSLIYDFSTLRDICTENYYNICKAKLDKKERNPMIKSIDFSNKSQEEKDRMKRAYLESISEKYELLGFQIKKVEEKDNKIYFTAFLVVNMTKFVPEINNTVGVKYRYEITYVKGGNNHFGYLIDNIN